MDQEFGGAGSRWSLRGGSRRPLHRRERGGLQHARLHSRGGRREDHHRPASSGGRRSPVAGKGEPHRRCHPTVGVDTPPQGWQPRLCRSEREDLARRSMAGVRPRHHRATTARGAATPDAGTPGSRAARGGPCAVGLERRLGRSGLQPALGGDAWLSSRRSQRPRGLVDLGCAPRRLAAGSEGVGGLLSRTAI